ncbi:MAG: SpoIIE family protein phosphatase [bacterium]|nr:SpoIIE family protein phosphatase [bacterium]
MSQIKWYKSLSFLGLLGLALIPLWDLIGVAVIMRTRGHDLVVQESARLLEETGNTAIAEIGERSREIGGLARSVALAAEVLPRDPRLIQKLLPHMIGFHGDMDVAGGGVWPEPGAFTPGVARRSFFYGREADGTLKYYDDYNRGRGYHNDEWYPVVRYSAPGRCFWSKSYMDPYSYQPMVTCSVAMRNPQSGKFWGVSTIDLKLEGLHAFMEGIRKKTGGYVFLLDRNNQFLTFPEPDRVKLIAWDALGKRTETFIDAESLARQEPDFAPIAAAVEAMNRDILERGRRSPNYDSTIAARIDADSDQISRAEAESIATVIADPLRAGRESTHLYRKFQIQRDFMNREASLVLIFSVPESYWKLVAVKPLSEAQAVAAQISNSLILLITITICLGVAFAALMMRFFFTRPIKTTIDAVQKVGSLVSEGRFSELSAHEIPAHRDNELGRLAGVINSLGRALQNSYTSLMDLNANLEKKVDARTEEIQANLDEIQELKLKQDADYYLTAQLVKPLGGNHSRNEQVEIDYLIRQKKQFVFKTKQAEIGGDLCVSHSLVLRGRPTTVFLNADAMGKSIQGAGGVLVLGAIFDANITRTKLSSTLRSQSPERWLKNAITEMQKVFEAFDGFMLISLCMGMVDEHSGTLLYVNAEHPRLVLYRDGQASYPPARPPLRKLGFMLAPNDRLFIDSLRLMPGDVVISGSDGRDDLEVGVDERGHRIMNEDENLFLAIVEAADGDLSKIEQALQKEGDFSDDLSLLRVTYRGEFADLAPASLANLKAARARIAAKDYATALEILESDPARDHARLLATRAKLNDRLGDARRGASLALQYLDNHPWDTGFLYHVVQILFRAGFIDLAVDAGERLRLRRPDHRRNLEQLARIYEEELGNRERAAELRAESAQAASRSATE